MQYKLLATTALVAVLSVTNAQAYDVTTDGSLNEAIQDKLDENGVLNENLNLKAEKHDTSLTLKNIIIKSTNDGGVVLRKGSEITLGDGTSSIDISSTDGTALEVVANASKIYVNAKDVKLNSEKAGEAGIWAQNNTQEETDESKLSRVEVHADTIDISAKSNGVVAMSQGQVVLEGNTTIKAEDAILTRGYAKTEINKSGERTLKMDGNINFDYDKDTSGTSVDAKVDVTLVGAESYWKGNTIVSWDTKPDVSKLTVSDATIRLIDGATWTATTITDNPVDENGSYYTALNNLIINKGTVNIEDTTRGISVDKIEATDATFNGGVLNVNKTMTISGNLELNNNIAGSGTVEFKEGSSLKAELEKTATKTTIAASTIKGSTTMVLENGSEGGQIKFSGDQTEFKFADNALFDISEDSGVYTFSKKSSDEVAEAVGATSNQASTITAVTSGAASEENQTFNTIANNINSLMQSGNPADVKTALDASTALAPEVAPAVQSTSTETTNQVFGAVGTRLSGGSVSTGSEGMSSGDNIFERVAVWVQGLFNKSKLDDTSKAKGFDADSNGVAFGIEKNVTDDTKLGVGYAYTNTDIDGFMRTTDVDTHTAILYGEYKPSRWFVNGIATYGWSDYSENKNVTGIGVKADYDVDTFGLQAMTGYDMNIKGFGFTPEAGLRYVHIKQDAYKDSADQKVYGNNSDILTGVIGVKISKNFELSNGVNLKPEARVAATYDLKNDDVNSVVTLANGAAYAVEGKALKRFGMEFGAGVTAEVNDSVELSLGYEGKFREDYQDHTGLINAKYKF